MLPQTVLDASPRGGPKYAKAAAAYTVDGTLAIRLPCGTVPNELRPRDGTLLWGLRGKGSTARLVQPCLLKAFAVTPLRRWPRLGRSTLPFGPDITPAAVSRALRGFPTSNAPGPSGLRVQHLRNACLPNSTDAFIDHLQTIVGLLSNGQACAAAAPFLAGASLAAVPKPRGGVRPIAIGEVLRRLNGKCLMDSVRGRAREHLLSAQVGVAVPAGAEAAVHAVRAWATRHREADNKVLLKLDFANAFNSVQTTGASPCAVTVP